MKCTQKINVIARINSYFSVVFHTKIAQKYLYTPLLLSTKH